MDKKALIEQVVEKLQKEVTELEESMMSMKQAIEAPDAMQS
jgi:exonuclease VII small subunit